MGQETLVYLVAEFEPLRLGMVNLIEAEPGMRVLGSAHTLEEMAESDLYRDADVIVADVETVNRGNLAAVYHRIGEWLPALRVLFLGSEADGREIRPDAIPTYMGLHTVGFVQKNGPSGRVIDAIRLVANGAFVCEMQVIRHILTRLSRWANSTCPPNQIDQLSDRETEVLALVARGLSNKEIAQELFLSEGTVKIHVSHIMTKLDKDRRTELVRFALARGLVPLEQV